MINFPMDLPMRMLRIKHYFSRTLREKTSKTPHICPFIEMKVGDFFDVAREDCVIGNLQAHCSQEGKRLGKKFSTRMRLGKLRVTRTL